MLSKIIAVRTTIINDRLIELKNKIMTGYIQAALFDCDGVITDTEPLHYISWEMAFKNVGITQKHDPALVQGLPGRVGTFNVLKQVDMVPAEMDIAMLESKMPDADVQKLNILIKSIVNDKNKYYLELIEKEKLIPMPGIESLLKMLQKYNVKMALVSSSSSAEQVLKNLGLNKYFDDSAIITGKDVGQYSVLQKTILRGKPYPDVFLEGAARLRVLAKRCIGFEDTVGGISAINNAGILSIGYDPTRKNELGEAYLDIYNFSQLIDVLG
ncbi:MAG: hypothetical protein DKM50_08275 [Candidatus Margulisiibacteriota bacterium]|nr:MAG: hypothetical protein A2X43_03055 [Candidatus Margulisbacteria bacterium GWD2_39_127]OGI04991.1 MAG: hypothetical protein A2X42_05320 [Candidatus Margulisbacteria bacterium GWF2_38_17]PZM79591.1 MAG: hypothetical protein DKM50_08275 [Candidatus Margulisiibacteriota bacterium]HAR63227.1 hypothetical protein [Candidatus Margulisiibacteriota bacterium]HCT83783.1 hypothetical protein [Candidatus Margulisiibacteriota bacterium]